LRRPCLHAYRVTAASAVHSQCCVCSAHSYTHARYVFFFCLPTPASPCWRCTTRCCGEAKRHHIRLYHGWPARVATCALLARLPAQRCADLNTAHYLIPRGHQPPYNKSLLPGLGPRDLSGSPLLCSGACWECPLILLSPACSIYSASARDHQ